VHAPVAGDLQPVQPSVQAPVVRRLKLAPALAEQVEVEGDPAEVVVVQGRQPGADLGGDSDVVIPPESAAREVRRHSTHVAQGA
jgi:hypothetical protein